MSPDSPGDAIQIEGPQGAFVIRAEPDGVPSQSFIAGAWWLWAQLRRKARRESGWVVTIRRRSDDPFGSPVYTEAVETKADVPEAMSHARSLVVQGQVQPPD